MRRKLRSGKLSLAVLAGVIAISGVGPVSGAAQASHGPDAAHVLVSGDVKQPLMLSVADLQSLPNVTETVSFMGAHGLETHTETGPLLLTVLNEAGLEADATIKNDKLRNWITATGSDGYRAVLSWGEIDPDYADAPVLVAWQEDGGPLAGSDAPARLVVPGDKLGGRYIFGLVRIAVDDQD
jgi:DMSO/TMAO reductase YedYZ molybdopterin-dependent catalytic subunit